MTTMMCRSESHETITHSGRGNFQLFPGQTLTSAGRLIIEAHANLD